MSDRQPKRKSKKFTARKLFRRINNNNKEGDGYESSSDASTGSTRSTSSSFLRYQNRALWKARLIKKSVLQRHEGGVETPVEDEPNNKPWLTFDRIYKRQNQVLKKGDIELDDEEDDDADSNSSAGSDTCPLAPPAPIYSIDTEDEEECVVEGEEVEYEQPTEDRKESAQHKVFGRIKKFVTRSSSDVQDEESKTEHFKEEVEEDKESPTTEESLDIPLETETENDTVTTQESGIPTSEAPKAQPQARPDFPIQKLTQSTADTTSSDGLQQSPLAKPPRPPRQKKKISFREDEKADIEPISIPRTISYSLRSAIGDGSTRQRNSHSLMERRPLRPNGCSVDVSYWSHKGKRNYMEDRFVIEHMGSTSKNKEESKPISLLAVFDGHGGSAASQFCSDWISSYIRKKNPHYPDNLPMAMSTAFTKIDSDFVSTGLFDGTTACAAAVVGNKVICCNAGDSRAIIVKRDGTAVPLSQDHKPDRNDETKRINDLGGRVIHWGRWRVEGVLAVSRSIGDARLKPYVTAEPDIVEHEIEDDDMFLVVAR